MQIATYLRFALSWIHVVNAHISSRDATDWASLHCPEDSSSVLPTPTYGYTSAVFTVCTEKLINASAELIYNTIIDFRAYPLWNSFVVDVNLPGNVTETPEDVYIGMPMTFTTTGLIPLINTTSDETVTVLDSRTDSGYSLAAWEGFGFSEHPNILVDQGGGVTRYLSYETYYYALLATPVLALRPALQDQFEKQGQDLLTYVHSLV